MAKAKSKDKKKAIAKKAKPVAKAKSKPVAKKVSKPVAKKAKPAPKKAAKPVKKVAKPVAKKAKPAPAKKVAAKQSKPVLKNTTSKVKPAAVKSVKPSKPEVKPAVVKSTSVAQPKTAANKIQQPGVTNVVAKPIDKKPEKKMKDEKAMHTTPELNLRYSDEELKEFKDLIDKKLFAAREELKNLKEALDNHTESQAGNKAWNMEEGTDTSEMEYLMNQISRQHTFIRNLELALVRIENKTYGICRASGKLIPKERLRVVPHATLSLEAKNSRRVEEESPAASLTNAPPTDFAEGFEE
ncbi:MAG: TraR/DksA C4-type zinc finger protein [Chitinophagales bacterium]